MVLLHGGRLRSTYTCTCVCACTCMCVLWDILFVLSLLVIGHQRGSHDVQEKEKSSSWSVDLSHTHCMLYSVRYIATVSATVTQCNVYSQTSELPWVGDW